MDLPEVTAAECCGPQATKLTTHDSFSLDLRRFRVGKWRAHLASTEAESAPEKIYAACARGEIRGPEEDLIERCILSDRDINKMESPFSPIKTRRTYVVMQTSCFIHVPPFCHKEHALSTRAHLPHAVLEARCISAHVQLNLQKISEIQLRNERSLCTSLGFSRLFALRLWEKGMLPQQYSASRFVPLDRLIRLMAHRWMPKV